MAPTPRNEEKKGTLMFAWLPGDCHVLFVAPAIVKVTGRSVCWFWFFLKGNPVGHKFLSACYLDIEGEKGK